MKWIYLTALMVGCTSSETRVAECQKGIGEACNQLGREAEGKAAEGYFRRACELANTNGCVNLAAHLGDRDPAETKRVLAYACDRGNTNACARLVTFLAR